MKISRRRGRVRLTLTPQEGQLLAGLFDDLAQALRDLPADDPVRLRLYPDGHRDDPQIAAQYRELTASSLQEERLARVELCRAEVSTALPAEDAANGGTANAGTGNSATTNSGTGTIELAPDDVRRWLQVSNDLRLSIGTRLGITDEQQGVDLAGFDPQTTQVWAIYHWLSVFQENILDSVM